MHGIIIFSSVSSYCVHLVVIKNRKKNKLKKKINNVRLRVDSVFLCPSSANETRKWARPARQKWPRDLLFKCIHPLFIEVRISAWIGENIYTSTIFPF